MPGEDWYGSQNSLRQHFGFDQQQLVDKLVVRSPTSGTLETFEQVAANFETANNGGGVTVFHNNRNGTFTEVTDRVGIRTTGWTLDLGTGTLTTTGSFLRAI